MHHSIVHTLRLSLPSVGAIANQIAERAAGNPFFAEEMVRELAESGVLHGDRAAYVCRGDIGDLSLPATLQATIAARIDRLAPAAKRALGAASVIGSRFDPDLLGKLGVEPAIDELVGAELIDREGITSLAEYAFRHPLIRAVAYESQLNAERAELHRRAADVIDRPRCRRGALISNVASCLTTMTHPFVSGIAALPGGCRGSSSTSAA